MNSDAAFNPLMVKTTSRRAKPDWKGAIRAARRLSENPDDTQLAYEVLDRLEPDRHAKGLAGLLATPGGRHRFRQYTSLGDLLTNDDSMSHFPEGSVGRAYLDHMQKYNLSANSLLTLRREYDAKRQLSDPDLTWYAERNTVAHDLYHALTGYGANPVGEAALLWFMYGQDGGRANWLLMVTSALRIAFQRGFAYLAVFLFALKRGKSATKLSALDLENFLPLQLDDARKLLGLIPHKPKHIALLNS